MTTGSGCRRKDGGTRSGRRAGPGGTRRATKAKRKDMALGGVCSCCRCSFGVVVFYIWPIVRNAYFSFTTWGVFGGADVERTDNYEHDARHDPMFWRSILNTLIYVGVPAAAASHSR